MNAYCVISDSGTLPEESSFYTSIGHPIPAVCIRDSTERPEALDKGCFRLLVRMFAPVAVEPGLGIFLANKNFKHTDRSLAGHSLTSIMLSHFLKRLEVLSLPF